MRIRGSGAARIYDAAGAVPASLRDLRIVVHLATRRAAPFYRALGYEHSAIYHRKMLGGQAME